MLFFFFLNWVYEYRRIILITLNQITPFTFENLGIQSLQGHPGIYSYFCSSTALPGRAVSTEKLREKVVRNLQQLVSGDSQVGSDRWD